MNKLVLEEVELLHKTNENDCDAAFDELNAALERAGVSMVPTHKRILASVNNADGDEVSYSAYPRDIEFDEDDDEFYDESDGEEDIFIACGYEDSCSDGYDEKYARKESDAPNEIWIKEVTLVFETQEETWEKAFRTLRKRLKENGIEFESDRVLRDWYVEGDHQNSGNLFLEDFDENDEAEEKVEERSMPDEITLIFDDDNMAHRVVPVTIYVEDEKQAELLMKYLSDHHKEISEAISSPDNQ